MSGVAFIQLKWTTQNDLCLQAKEAYLNEEGKRISRRAAENNELHRRPRISSYLDSVPEWIFNIKGKAYK